jgi:hypothetical protein
VAQRGAHLLGHAVQGVAHHLQGGRRLVTHEREAIVTTRVPAASTRA